MKGALAAAALLLLNVHDAAGQAVDINPNYAGFTAQPPIGVGNCPHPCLSGGSGGRVNGVAIVPDNPSIAFAASEAGGLFKSIDGGATWMHVDGHVPTRMWDVVAAGGQRLYATSFYDWRVDSQSGIEMSSDGGATWSRPSIDPPAGCAPNRVSQPSAFGIALRAGAPGEVLVGTNCGIARTFDGGAHWTQFDPTPLDGVSNSVWDVAALAGGLTYACGDDGLLRSSNGTGWTRLGRPPKFAGGFCSLAVSPDEPSRVAFVVFAQPGFGDYIVPRGGVFYEYDDDTDDKWTELPSPDPFAPEPKRSAYVATNDRSDGFDLWIAAGDVYRAVCRTPLAPGPRCPTVLGVPPDRWSGPFTDAAGNLTKTHGDTGALAFDPTAGIDACPVLYSSDGGIYRNEPLPGTDCHADARFMPVNVGVHTQLLLGMEGVDRAGDLEEDIYLALQDNGLFYTHNAGSNSPAWQQGVGGDMNDIVADTMRTVAATYWLMVGDPGFINMTIAIGDPPWSDCIAHGVFEVIDQVPLTAGRYVMAIGAYGSKCTIPRSVRLTNDIDANPLGVALGTWPSDRAPCNMRAATGPGGLEVFVQAGFCDFSHADELWKYVDANGTWTLVTPAGATGIAMFTVDPVNPGRVYAAAVGGGNSRMVRSDTGGASWVVDDDLTNLMHGFGAFVPQARDNGDGVTYPYVQATLAAFDPENPNIVVAGGRESGVFLSSDAGDSWARITDPLTPGATGIVHLPRPFFAHFDHEPAGRTSIYIGTEGRGVWRFDLANADLSVVKSADFDRVGSGADLTYSIQVTNAGPDAAMNVTMEDTLPAATSFQGLVAPAGWSCETPQVGSTGRVRCTATSITPGSAAFTIVVRLFSGTSAGTLLANRVRAFSGAVDPNPANNAATQTTIAVTADACKGGGWRTFTNPAFRNQGQCVQWINNGK